MHTHLTPSFAGAPSDLDAGTRELLVEMLLTLQRLRELPAAQLLAPLPAAKDGKVRLAGAASMLVSWHPLGSQCTACSPPCRALNTGKGQQGQRQQGQGELEWEQAEKFLTDCNQSMQCIDPHINPFTGQPLTPLLRPSLRFQTHCSALMLFKCVPVCLGMSYLVGLGGLHLGLWKKHLVKTLAAVRDSRILPPSLHFSDSDPTRSILPAYLPAGVVWSLIKTAD